jgi:hypothetical protein
MLATHLHLVPQLSTSFLHGLMRVPKVHDLMEILGLGGARKGMEEQLSHVHPRQVLQWDISFVPDTEVAWEFEPMGICVALAKQYRSSQECLPPRALVILLGCATHLPFVGEAEEEQQQRLTHTYRALWEVIRRATWCRSLSRWLELEASFRKCH